MFSLMNYEEKLSKAKELKGKGVEKYKIGDISTAKDFFTRAIAYLEDMDKNDAKETEGIELYVTILSNLCNCFNRLKKYDSVINLASKGLKIKELPKLYYFRAIAYANNEEINLSKKDLNSLKKILGQESNKDEGIKNLEVLIEEKQKEINDYITIKYQNNKKESKIRIFGFIFVINNYNNCKYIYEKNI